MLKSFHRPIPIVRNSYFQIESSGTCSPWLDHRLG
uniref:Uncharacterized protein n=1 Tax=Anguilla anguilla TaxID=7936 RepID=A0A0E9WEE8_ANGAN